MTYVNYFTHYSEGTKHRIHIQDIPGLFSICRSVHFTIYFHLRTDDTIKKIDAWIDIYFLTYFHCKL
jgi:hypothetical protein